MEEKPFTCSVAGCQFASAWEVSLKSHMLAVHAKEKPFACSVAGCHYRSAYQSSLSNHRQSVHDGRRVTCPHKGCGLTLRPHHVKKHVDGIHKKVLRFSCHVCGKSFYLKSTLQGHQQVHAKQGHPVADCASCQEDLKEQIKQSSHVIQKDQSPSFEGISDLLTTLHLDLHLLSSQN